MNVEQFFSRDFVSLEIDINEHETNKRILGGKIHLDLFIWLI